MINSILGLLLHYANRHPMILFKNEFYALKTKLLQRRGTKVGTQLQHIKKDCYRCNDGIYYSHYKAAEECWYCGGTGVYDEFWTELGYYRLGKFYFHVPIKRHYADPGGVLSINPIEGYIQHKAPRHYLAYECAFWLFFLFDRETFYKSFIKSTSMCIPLRNIRTPMVLIHTLIVMKYWEEDEEVDLPF